MRWADTIRASIVGDENGSYLIDTRDFLRNPLHTEAVDRGWDGNWETTQKALLVQAEVAQPVNYPPKKIKSQRK